MPAGVAGRVWIFCDSLADESSILIGNVLYSGTILPVIQPVRDEKIIHGQYEAPPDIPYWPAQVGHDVHSGCPGTSFRSTYPTRLYYPEIGREGIAHHELADEFAMQPRLARRGLWRQITQKAGQQQCDHVVFSSEVFQKIPRPDRFYGALPKADVRIVLYVRNLVDYFNSTYQQHVYANSLVDTVEDRIARFKYRHRSFLARWATAFGARLDVVNFERNLLKNGDVVADFLDRIGGYSLPASHVPERNPSISGNLLHFKRIHNFFRRRKSPPEVLRALDSLAFENPRFRGRLKLSPSAFARLKEITAADEAFIRETFLPDFKSPDAPTGFGFDPESWDRDFDHIYQRMIEFGLRLPPREDMLAQHALELEGGGGATLSA